MPVLSNRVQRTFQSPFRKFLPLAQAAKDRGTKVIHLNIGQPDFAMPAGAMDGIKEGAYIPYGTAEGQIELRTVWCEYYKRFSIDIAIDDTLITCGASEGIYFALMGIADLGDEIIVPEPFYANYIGFRSLR